MKFIVKFTGDENATDKVWTAYSIEKDFIADVTVRDNGTFEYIGRVKVERGAERLKCFQFKQQLETEVLNSNNQKFKKYGKSNS